MKQTKELVENTPGSSVSLYITLNPPLPLPPPPCLFRYIGKEESETSKERREIGNVRSDHEISFEYGVRKIKPKEAPKHNPLLQRISEVSSSMEGQ